MPDELPNPSDAEFRSILGVLREHKVSFLVIGGRAEGLMGGSRVTYDSDFTYERTPANLEKLAAALKAMDVRLRGVPADLPFQLDARSLLAGTNFTFTSVMGDIDLLGWVEPIGEFDKLIPNAERYVIDGTEVLTIGLDDLIRVKQHIRRDKDRESLRQLLAIRLIRRETGLR